MGEIEFLLCLDKQSYRYLPFFSLLKKNKKNYSKYRSVKMTEVHEKFAFGPGTTTISNKEKMERK